MIDVLLDRFRSVDCTYAIDGKKAQNVIIEPAHKDNNFLIGISLNYTRDGVMVHSIRGLFPKDTLGWMNWIKQGKALYLDKEKVRNKITQWRTSPANVSRLDPNSIISIVENFQNANEKTEKNENLQLSLRRNKQVNPIREKGPTKKWYQKELNSYMYDSFVREQVDSEAEHFIERITADEADTLKDGGSVVSAVVTDIQYNYIEG